MKSHLLIRMAAAAVLLTGLAAGAAATASPASAIQQCTDYKSVSNYGVTAGPTVYVEWYLECVSAPFSIPEGVQISKYVGGVGWEVVAGGYGYITYACTGGRFLYTTNITSIEGKPAFYCGLQGQR